MTTKGEQFVHSLPLKSAFYDRHERREYLRTVEVAKRLIDTPSLIENGARYLERFVKDDPNQRSSYLLWTAMIERSVEEIARSLLEDSPRGAELRSSAPVFHVFSPEDLRAIWQPIT
jgi:hypothetical protein